jgi:hypothetical protein
MILSFSKVLNGKRTYFVERIWEGFFRNERFDLTEQLFHSYYNQHKRRFGHVWDELPLGKPRMENPKIHTIREDVADRWKEGTPIHYTINNRSKDSFRFAPVIPCTSTQPILMTLEPDGIYIAVSGRPLAPAEKVELALNDGFDTWEDFEAVFMSMLKKKPDNWMAGKIIHWTDHKY